MRVSEYYRLGRTQPSLSFVDVDLHGDVKLFISPRALRLLLAPWGDECVSLIQNYFGTVVELIRNKKHADAEALLRVLKEPNETHLGLSEDEARGRGLGTDSAHDVWQAFARSKAAQSGLLTDLEDTILMIDGIRADIVSDITTNIIRAPLIKFTQETCRFYGIPLESQVDSGPLWDPHARSWYSRYDELPVPDDKKLLLVPKEIVRADMDYDVEKYYRHYILEHLKEVELDANSELVKILKSGERRVTKKSVKEKYGSGKAMITEHTLKNPDLLKQYKNDNAKPSPPLSHRQLADIESSPEPDWDALVNAVIHLPVGNAAAADYEKNIEALLSALFYPVLAHPKPQTMIHEGRKRIDITYTNMGGTGFFEWLSKHYPSAHVFIECKNYGRAIENPELDQISGRFSVSRGKFGIIVCRKLKNRPKFELRCRDTAMDHRGYVIALDDADLKTLANARKKQEKDFFNLPLLKNRFDALVM